MRTLTVALVLAGLLVPLGPACSKKKSSSGVGISVPAVGCGEQVLETVAGKGSPTPVFSDQESLAFYRVSPIPADATSITITLTSTTGDADLHLAGPGTGPGTPDPASYILASQEVSPLNVDTIQVSLAGIQSPMATVPSPTLMDYLAGGTGIPFAVWGVQSTTDFDLQVTCGNSVTLPCGLDVWSEVQGSGTVPPDFAGGTEVHFFEVQGLPASPGSVSILANSTQGDVNLYLGVPGLTAPGADPSEYVFSSTASSVASLDDLILLDGTGLHDVFGSVNPLTTLQDYISAGGTLWFAVAGLEAANEYTLRVTCSPVDPVGCGGTRAGSLNGSSQSPPDLGEATETRFFQFDALPPTASSVTITLNSNTGDADLYLAAPGVLPGSAVPGDYIFSSEEHTPSPTADQITMDPTGLQNSAGGSNPGVTLNDYIQSAVPIGLAVAGFDPLTSFTLQVTCVAPPQVLSIDCGGATSGTLTGSGGPNFSNIRQNLWYELSGIPPGTNRIEIVLSSISGDVDLYLAAPGVVPGSQNIGDYPVMSIAGGWPDQITICPGGVGGLFGSQTSPTLGDYTASPENLSFVVAGSAAQSSFTLQVGCSSGPAQLPTTVVDCGSVTPDLLDGSFRFPPDFDNTGEVHLYEVPLASIQGAATLVRIRIDLVAGGDADLYLAAPGTTPGSTCYSEYVFRDLSGGARDWIRIRASGLDASGGATSGAYNLGDYQNASTNLSFAVAGFTSTVPVDLRIICN